MSFIQITKRGYLYFRQGRKPSHVVGAHAAQTDMGYAEPVAGGNLTGKAG
jgi:hypothetical protein